MSLTDTRTDGIVDQFPKGLLDRIVAHLNPQKVILFGSRAAGKTHEDSDWDFLVIVDDDIPPERIGWRSMYEARRGIHSPIDLIPCRESTFRNRSDIVGSLPWIAATEGTVVYERTN
ncbi:MAG: nucleotidyltransferase domain-containing protein [Xanthobacteraceae bacterium]